MKNDLLDIILKCYDFIGKYFLRFLVDDYKSLNQMKKLIVKTSIFGIFIIFLIGTFEYSYNIVENNNDFVNAVDKYYQGNYKEANDYIEKSSNNNSVEEYYIRGSINYKLGKYNKALQNLAFVSESEYIKKNDSLPFFDIYRLHFFSESNNYTLSKPNAYIETCLMKSECKIKLKDYRGAILDAKTGIDSLVKYQNWFDDKLQLNNIFISLNYNIGLSSYKIKDINQSLISFNTVIKYKGEHLFPEAYSYKGLISQMKKEKDSACLYYSKAGELGDTNAYNYIKKYCK